MPHLVVNLTRVPDPDYSAGYLGVHTSDGSGSLFLKQRTLELPWRDNEQNVSCIPKGEYNIIRRYEGDFYNAYKKRWGHKFSIHVDGVPGRTVILFHTGNVLGHTRGCILTGTEFLLHKGQPYIQNSRVAYIEFHKVLEGHFNKGWDVKLRVSDMAAWDPEQFAVEDEADITAGDRSNL